jgi:hypothetical protein
MFFATAFADMKVTLNTTYSSNLDDTSSDEYATFTKDFCSEVGIWIKLKSMHSVTSSKFPLDW